MFDLPLHPIAVHFPISVGVLLPLVAIGVLWAIKTNKVGHQVWVIMPFLSALYLGSAIAAVQLGEQDEEKVEKVVGHDTLEEHEEIGEKVPWTAGALLAISILPLVLRKANPSWLYLLFILASLGGLYPLVTAGHTGGELVYEHGAAKAHTKRFEVIKDYNINEKNREYKDEHHQEED